MTAIQCGRLDSMTYSVTNLVSQNHKRGGDQDFFVKRKGLIHIREGVSRQERGVSTTFY